MQHYIRVSLPYSSKHSGVMHTSSLPTSDLHLVSVFAEYYLTSLHIS